MLVFILIFELVSANPVKFQSNNDIGNLNFDNIQVCPGGTLEINIILVNKPCMEEVCQNSLSMEEKEELLCVQNNEKTILNCHQGNYTQNNLEISQKCFEGTECIQLNGRNNGATISTSTTTTTTTTTTTSSKPLQFQQPLQLFLIIFFNRVSHFATSKVKYLMKNAFHFVMFNWSERIVIIFTLNKYLLFLFILIFI